MDGHYAVVLDLVWNNASSDATPQIESVTIPVADYAADEELEKEMKKAYAGLKKFESCLLFDYNL